MKVYITKTFEKFILKHFSNYFIDINEFSEQIKKTFLDDIYLKRPLMKFKIKINQLSYRIVGIVKDEKIIPILVFLKRDKKIGENLIWNRELEILINHYSSKIKLDMDNKKFKIY